MGRCSIGNRLGRIFKLYRIKESSMDRKDLLLEQTPTERELSQNEESRLKKAVDDGGIFLALVSSPGWKKLMNDFISGRLAQDRYLGAKTEDLADIRAAQKELIDLLQFVKRAVEEGEKSYKMLNKNSK
jgi:hypothetical protein